MTRSPDAGRLAGRDRAGVGEALLQVLVAARVFCAERVKVQMNMLVDYHSNVEQYPAWQRYLRERPPPTLVVWGKNDSLFTPAGATAFQRDVPGFQEPKSTCWTPATSRCRKTVQPSPGM